jgi:hypothetical protein
MPIFWKSKIVLVKIEAAYGVDPGPTGAANAMLMTNVAFSPMEGDDVARDLERPYLGAQATIPVGLRGKLTGRVELVPSGAAGTAPAWGPLLRACAVAQTVNAGVSVVYNPISDAMESATIHFWIGGTQHVLRGARGNATLRWGAQQIPYIEFDLTGLWSQPAEVARATPTLTAFQKPDAVTDANTPTFSLNGVTMILREATLALNNQVEPRLLVNSESILVVDRNDMVSAKVEAVPVTTFNPYELARNQTTFALALTHGTLAGRIASLAAPACQMKRLSGFENAQNILEWPLEMAVLPVAGNDQWTLTLT